jgi:hypothetical protein
MSSAGDGDLRRLDTTRPSPARMYDYYLGGTNNTMIDRDAAQTLVEIVPELPDTAWANRGFLQRSALWMARRGIRQFIDIGAGLPTQNNSHEVVHKVDPSAHVVYVDNDPAVEVESEFLLRDTPNVTFVAGDLRDPGDLLENPQLRKSIDFSQPVGLLLVAVVHFVSDGLDPWGLVKRYMNAVVPGSHLSLSHITGDRRPPDKVKAFTDIYENATENLHFRSKDEIARFFEGLDIVTPYDGAERDVTYVGLWGCEDVELADSVGSRWGFCAVARKP